MKALKVVGNVIIGIILFALIFALTFTRSTKNFLEKDLILGVVKEKITDTIKEESGKITEKGESMLDDMLKDDESSNIIRMVLDNFESYQENKTNFKVSDADIEKIYNYAVKYKSTIVEISGNKVKDISDAEFKKIFSSENINKLANEVFGSFDKDLGDGIDTAIKIYGKATSNSVMLALIISIIFFTILLFLINWSWIKWMLVFGIDLIVCGVIISLFYVAGLFLNDIIGSVDVLEKAVGEINLGGYIIWGLSEFLIGILLVVLYNILKKKVGNENNNSYPTGNINQEVANISQN